MELEDTIERFRGPLIGLVLSRDLARYPPR